ncbi:glutathione S-transferase [Marivivens niveibacter]|uniref:Glutathione S-transferase n=1 Tax=Marivivens niveibacter TaxID=1930667 RepID=A0A251WWL1_9RHOB|nr:glutathione S-transferase [Marivivens niveibacter]OUD08353.1 glutathione S-transferase [Marivivens niveibacter]
MQLYDLELSGNCYKVRLFLSLIGQPYELIPVDFLGGAHKKPPLSDMNPFCEIPILTDGALTLRDSQAILIYLARQYGGEAWLPTEAASMAQVMEWVMMAENEIARGPNDARLHDKFGYELDHGLAVDKAKRVLSLLEAQLEGKEWLALDRPTIADIACFPYVALGHEGRIPVGDHPNVAAWINRIKSLPRFVTMPEL